MVGGKIEETPPISTTGCLGSTYTICECLFLGVTGVETAISRCYEWSKYGRCQNKEKLMPGYHKKKKGKGKKK